MLSRIDIQQTPGADRTNGMEMITDYVPASYMTHDMLHIMGGHQVSWLIDGVPIPNTNIATNLGPQIAPRDIDYLEAYSGSYDADYGDRTYGVFNVAPRTGFERDRECDLVLTAGKLLPDRRQISCGGHTQRFAYYASLNGNRSTYGLQTPIPQVVHDAVNGYGGFASFLFNPDAKNQYRLVTSLRRTTTRSPSTPIRTPSETRSIPRAACAMLSANLMVTSPSPGSTPSIPRPADDLALLPLQRRRLQRRPSRLPRHLDHRPERELRRGPDHPSTKPSEE